MPTRDNISSIQNTINQVMMVLKNLPDDQIEDVISFISSKDNREMYRKYNNSLAKQQFKKN